MDLDNDVGLGGNANTDSFGKAVGLAAGCPEAQFVGWDPRAGDGKVSRPREFGIELPPLPAGIDVSDEMVHRTAVSRSEIDRLEVRIFGQVGGEDEATVDVGARGGHREAFGRLENQVGRPELPALGKLGRRRQILGIALRGTGLGPSGEDLDLGVSTIGRV